MFGLKRGKKAQCVSNRCKDLYKRKKYFGVMGTLSLKNNSGIDGIRTHDLCDNGAIIKLFISDVTTYQTTIYYEVTQPRESC